MWKAEKKYNKGREEEGSRECREKGGNVWRKGMRKEDKEGKVDEGGGERGKVLYGGRTEMEVRDMREKKKGR